MHELRARSMWRKLIALATCLSCCLLASGQSDEQQQQQQEQQTLLARVCQASKRAEAPIFTSPAQVRQLISEHEASQDGSCEERFAEAFSELGQLLEPERLEDICSAQMYQLIRAYHAKFVHFYLPEATRDELLEAQRASNEVGAPIPEALRNFFILFAKQVGASCKQHLVASLQQMEARPLLSDEDFAVLEAYKGESRRLGFLYQLTKMGLSSYGRGGKADSFNELQIVDLLAARKASSELDEGAKLYVQVRFDDRLKRIKAACEHRFMPVYMELFAPVIRLNNLGYIDRVKSRLEDKQLNENAAFARWFPIIQACEVLKDIEVLHDSSAMSAIVGIIQDNSHLGAQDAQHQAQLRKVKILSWEEAEALRERLRKSEDAVQPAYDPNLIAMEHERVSFTPRMWLVQPKEARRELDQFHKDLDHFVWLRTSKLKAWRDDVKMMLKNFFHTHKNQIVERDEGSSLGRLAIFFERHRSAFTGISMIMSIIFLSMMLSG